MPQTSLPILAKLRNFVIGDSVFAVTDPSVVVVVVIVIDGVVVIFLVIGGIVDLIAVVVKSVTTSTTSVKWRKTRKSDQEFVALRVRTVP